MDLNVIGFEVITSASNFQFVNQDGGFTLKNYWHSKRLGGWMV